MNERLEIIAHLQDGFSTNDPWSPSIDSIIAAMVLREKLGSDNYRIDQAMCVMSTPYDLPLKKIDGDKWYWACSVPHYEITAVTIRSFYKKFNIDRLMLLDRKTKVVELTKNQFKNHSKTFRHIKTKTIRWVVDGNREEIERLLSSCQQIGGMRGKGHGFVTKWEITHSSKEILRWIPTNNADSGDVMYRGYRPCFRDTLNQSLCVLR